MPCDCANEFFLGEPTLQAISWVVKTKLRKEETCLRLTVITFQKFYFKAGPE